VPYLIAAVVLVSALGTLNLLLTLAVIRRLREHTELLATRGVTVAEGPDIIVVGQRPGDFTATTIDGRTVQRQHLTGETLVGFFSTGCPACVEALPRFVNWAAGFAGGRSQVLAVVTADDPTGDGLPGRLAGVARVVVESPEGTVATAFAAKGSPAWCLLDADGTVRDSGTGLRRIPVAESA